MKELLIVLCLILSSSILVGCNDGVVEDNPIINTSQALFEGFSDYIEPEYLEKITAIEFIDKVKVPSDVLKSWDLCENGEVKAWIVANDDDTYALTIAQKGGVVFPTDCWYMFSHVPNVKNINLENVDTSNVVDMSYMFMECSSLSALNLDNFDTSNVECMSGMFAYCSSLKTLDLSNFDTSNVIDMDEMFFDCTSLKELDLNNFSTSKLEDMSHMFYGCSALETLDLSNFDTASEPLMHGMLVGCENVNVIGLDPSKFDLEDIYNERLPSIQ